MKLILTRIAAPWAFCCRPMPHKWEVRVWAYILTFYVALRYPF